MDEKITNKNFPDKFLNEPSVNYEKAEMDLLREALNRSYTERFLFATRLYKIQKTFSKAKITHKRFPSSN